MEPPLPVQHEAMVKLRSYQQEMLDVSLQKNVIVAMDTGSGKTHIAVARIAAELAQSAPDKLVIFLAPAVALVEQQAEALSVNLQAYYVRALTGKDGVDKWTDQRLWDAMLANVRVLVCTPAIVLDALSHGFIRLERLSLCVFDEAHRTTKKHPMNDIMRLFYHPAKENADHVPHILGLTASPVVNSKPRSLETIESNLDAITVTPKNFRAELETYVNMPEIITVVYPKQDLQFVDPLCNALARAIRWYDFAQDPYVLELQENNDDWSKRKIEKVMLKRKTYCVEQLRGLQTRANSIQEHLGVSTARWYISECIYSFLDVRTSNDVSLSDLTERERERLGIIFHDIQTTASTSPTPSNSEVSHTLKVSKLLSILQDHAGTAPRAIIFVEQRVHTTALADLLCQIPNIAAAYKIGSFVGASVSTNRSASISDLVGIKGQQKDLQEFRTGQKNLMIATSALEEGIDVSACNLVICFDPPRNLVSFVQRRGRARQMRSKYFLFVRDDEMKQNNKQWQALEAEMKKTYMNDTRQLAEETEDEFALSNEVYLVETTGALLTPDNAKSHLYHFCSVGITYANNYIDLRPEFDTQQDAGKKLWTASVKLPSFVHPDVRIGKSSKAWCRETEAIKDAAFQAYISLHKAGLVNDNLLPLVKDFGPEVGQQHRDQPSMVCVSERQSSWQALWAAKDQSLSEWSLHSISIELDGSLVVEADVYLPSSALLTGVTKLHWNENTTYIATVQRKVVDSQTLGPGERNLLQKITELILRSVHGNRMDGQRQDFAFLFAPVATNRLEEWLEDATGVIPASCLTESAAYDVGLVRLRGQVGRSFFFHGWEHDVVAEDNSERGIVLTGFPKRKDFLHPVAQDSTGAAAYATKQPFAVGEGIVDKLPAKFALLAAFIPSILHRLDVAMLTKSLIRNVVGPVEIKDGSLLSEAISSPAAGESTDYNRLEFLGDSILKHCTEIQVVSQHTTWPEGYLSIERDRIVRNGNLAKAALEAGLDKYILTKPFTGSKWRPIYISENITEQSAQRQMSTKTLADVVEALIGAAFVDGGLEKAQKCIETLLPSETWYSRERCFDSLINELKPTKLTTLDLLERLVGHKFQNPTLLVEAITHASYPHVSTGLSYERLEFLGDSVLDLIIVPKLFAHPRKLRHWELHRIHEALVNSHFLGFCCMSYAIQEEKFDIVDRTPEQGRGHDITRSTRSIHLHNFLRADHQIILPLQKKSLAAFHWLKEAIDHALLTSPEYPWPELVALNPHKFFCDMVESVLGALFIDTRGDLSVCEAFVEKLGILTHMQRILDCHVDTFSPKERLGVVADRNAVRYTTSRSEGENGEKTFSCTVKVGDEDIVTASGCGNSNEAEVKAAHSACKILRGRKGAVSTRRKRKLETAGVLLGAEMSDDGEDTMQVEETRADR